GMSPTHISEIERGRTSPTVGALLRIARALKKPATYFVEENLLPNVSVVRKHERTHHIITESGHSVAGADFLTTGIPAGRLRVVELSDFERGPLSTRPHDGEEILLVESGALKVIVGDEEFELGAGDCIQFRATVPHRVEKVGSEEVRALWVTAAEGMIAL
ncbi:cupin domain-containing protein, partial [bacterium]|nr:cupin domain-containing protein [bacterium]